MAKETIEVINLTTHEIKAYPHQYSFSDTASMDIHTFYDTRFLCIEEAGLIGEGKLILTYFEYTSCSFEVASQFRSQEGQWNYGQAVAKVNNHSKIGWWKDSFTEELEFSFWDLSKNPEGMLSTVKVRNTLANLHGVTTLTLSVGSLWETEPDMFMLVGNSNVSTKNCFKEVYMVDSASSIVRNAKFSFSVKDKGNSMLHFFNLGAFSVFHCENWVGKDSMPATVYYVDNKEEKIMVKQEWQASTRSNFYLPGYDPNAIIEAIHDKGDVTEITVIAKRLMTISEMYMHLLLGIN